MFTSFTNPPPESIERFDPNTAQNYAVLEAALASTGAIKAPALADTTYSQYDDMIRMLIDSVPME